MKIYSAAAYARLSVKGEGRKRESMDTQLTLIREFIRTRADLELYDCYTDCGVSGTVFRRDGFCRMMQDVRESRIDCIIVKDLSRLGRNYLETGEYLEMIFPTMGVRFISLSEGIDTKNPEETDSLCLALRNLMNEWYARDIGIRVKKAKEAAFERGSFSGGRAAYGYRSEKEGNVRKLLVDEAAAEVVRGIRQKYQEGFSYVKIVEWLYEKRIRPPEDYRRSGCIYAEEGGELRRWHTATVRSLLQNPVYRGSLVQKGREWKDHHEPLF